MKLLYPSVALALAVQTSHLPAASSLEIQSIFGFSESNYAAADQQQQGVNQNIMSALLKASPEVSSGNIAAGSGSGGSKGGKGYYDDDYYMHNSKGGKGYYDDDYYRRGLQASNNKAPKTFNMGLRK